MERKFNIGDRVRVIREDSGHNAKQGMTGTIREISLGTYLPYGIEFDAPFMHGHDLSGLCPYGHGQYVAEEDIELIQAHNTIKVKIDNGSWLPQRAHPDDAGLDLYAAKDAVIESSGSEIFNTGVHVQIPKGYVGLLLSKSGLNVKHGITSEGVIDSGYTGSIVVKLYNNADCDYQVHRGDKISQLVLMPIITPELEIVQDFEETDRGDNGFGSTGR